MAMSRANVEVRAWLNGDNVAGVYTGKIVTRIGDVRVGRVTLSNDAAQAGFDDLQIYRVAVPDDSVLHIEVDRQIDSVNQQDLEVFKFANGILTKNHEVDNHKVEVNINWDDPEDNVEEHDEVEFITTIPEQPLRPVEIKMVSGHLTVVYTIGDEISFTEFIIALRRLLVDHRGREDIMDRHDFLNLSSTREHPLLARMRSDEPARWIHIKLQVEEPNRAWTTLLMRDDNLYVHGFMNQQGIVYGLEGNMLQIYDPQLLPMGVSYRSLLGAQNGDEVIWRLTDANLGRAFVVKAVRVLSSHPDNVDNINMSVGEALAGLIIIICESARLNPLHNSFAAGGWSNGTGFTEQLMRRYVWRWGDLSRNLREWKSRNYHFPQPIVCKEAVYLVINSRQLPRQRAGGPDATKTSGDIDSPQQSKKDSGPSSSLGGSGPSSSLGGSGEAPRRSQGSDPGKFESPSQQVEADDALGHGRARVELLGLAMHPEFLVDGIKIAVFDGKRRQIIYWKEELRQQEHQGRQGGQNMVDLLLTGPHRGITAEYGCFAIKIDSNNHPPSKFEWDCDDPNHAAQVDTMQPAHGIVKSPDGRKVAEVSYAVMSDAREATVQVGLQLKSGLNPVGASGKITSLIDGFNVPSVLFSCSEATGLLTSTAGDSWCLLQLARNVVAVPCCGVLHIHVNLEIKTDDGMEIELKAHLSFDNNGIHSSKTDNGNEVQVDVTWYPEADSFSGPWDSDWLPEQITRQEEADEMSTLTGPSEVTTVSEITLTEQSGVPSEVTTVSEEYETEVVYTIGDELSFLSFIMDLRRVAANHQEECEDILDGHSNSNLRSTREHPLLPKMRKVPARWLHIKMQAVEGNETSSTTLAMRHDTLYAHGFMNQQGVWYELAGDQTRGSQPMLPKECNAEPIHLGGHLGGIGYSSLLGARGFTEAVKILVNAHLGRQFAMDAVRRLSSFNRIDDWKVDGLMSAGLALAGLIFMVCESARMNPVLDSVVGGWSTGTGLTKQLITDYVWKYGEMSRSLREWKARNYAEPIPYSELRAIHLVRNGPGPGPRPRPSTRAARGVHV